MAPDGLLYVTDRYGNRVEVFDKQGNFKRNIPVRNEKLPLPDPSGTALWVAFSPDPAQKYMYVTDEHYDTVDIFDRAEKTTGDQQRVLYEQAASELLKAVNQEPKHPQAPLALLLALQLTVAPPLGPSQVQVHGPSPPTAEA